MNESNLEPIEPRRNLTLLDIVAAAISELPGGSFLASIWTNFHANRRASRSEETLNETIRLFKSGQYPLDPENISDDEMQLFHEVLQKASMARTEEKRKQYARLVASAWTDARNLPFDERMLFINALSAFTEHHIKTLSILNDAGLDASEPYADLRSAVASSLSTDVEKDSLMIPILDALAAQFGFIHRAWGLNDPSYETKTLFSKNLGSEKIARKCNHAITPLGQRFMRSLNEKQA